MIKAFLFDIGNVLVNVDHAQAVTKIERHSDASREEIRDVMVKLIEPLETGRISSKEFLEQAITGTRYLGSEKEFSAAYCDIFQINEPMWKLAGILSQRYPLYLFSNTSELHLQYLETKFPQMALFKGGIYSMRVGAMKPQPDIYQTAIELLQVDPAEIFYIDDLPENITEGQNQGFQTHRYFYQRHEELLVELWTVLPGKKTSVAVCND